MVVRGPMLLADLIDSLAGELFGIRPKDTPDESRFFDLDLDRTILRDRPGVIRHCWSILPFLATRYALASNDGSSYTRKE
jgi:hypothetical protein